MVVVSSPASLTLALLQGAQASESKGRNLETRQVVFVHGYSLGKGSNMCSLAAVGLVLAAGSTPGSFGEGSPPRGYFFASRSTWLSSQLCSLSLCPLCLCKLQLEAPTGQVKGTRLHPAKSSPGAPTFRLAAATDMLGGKQGHGALRAALNFHHFQAPFLPLSRSAQRRCSAGTAERSSFPAATIRARLPTCPYCCRAPDSTTSCSAFLLRGFSAAGQEKLGAENLGAGGC